VPQQQPVADAVIVAAGAGRRMGGDKSKVLRLLAGQPVLSYVLRVFQQSSLIRRIVVVSRDEDRSEFSEIIHSENITKAFHWRSGDESGEVFWADGGTSRAGSVYHGLKALKRQPDPPHWVIIQDGARPFLQKEWIGQSLAAAQKTGAAVVAHPVFDTIKEVDDKHLLHKTIDRSRLWAVQTPQTFHYPELLKAYQNLPGNEDWSSWTDDAMVMEYRGIPAAVVEGSRTNLKITTEEDLAFAEFILSEREV
jgi:2-C-methyl-D-erythritol 4-phosphate cytidylyltransferase